MLRSIVAVWSLALALIVIAATAGCDWGGCANGDDCSAGLTPPSMPDMAMLPTCSTACPVCSTGETCYQPAVSARLPAFCALACADDRDCPANQICAIFDAGIPPVCIAVGAPKSCIAGYNPGQTVGTQCLDANTVERPFSHPDDGVSGWELVHCASGCSNGACT